MEKNIVRKKDYEIYNIPLPLKVLFQGRKNKFLYGELEKRHPCFSKDWIFYSKLLLKKKKFYAETLVVNRVKMAEYKASKPLCPMLFETKDGKHTRLWYQWGKYLFYLLIFCSVLLGLVFLITAGRKSVNRNESDSLTDSVSLNQLEESFVRNESVNAFLNEMEIRGGKLNYFEWYSDGFKEFFNGSVSSVYAEQLECGVKSVSSVVYKNGSPSFSVNIEDFVENSDGDLVVKKAVSERDFFQSARRCLEAFGLSISEENFAEISFSFSGKDFFETGESNLFLALNKLSSVNHYGIKKIQIQKTDEKSNCFSGIVCFSGQMSYEQGINLEKIGWRPNLLFKKQQVGVVLPVKNHPVKQESVPGIKVGEIKHGDGTVSVYYKNQKGKIICVK